MTKTNHAAEAMLRAQGQEHLFAAWPNSPPIEDTRRFFAQIEQLDASYPGGVSGYVASAQQLLSDSKAGVNPLDGWTPSVPTGESLDFGRSPLPRRACPSSCCRIEQLACALVSSAAYATHEAAGASELEACAFVLVAGGLGANFFPRLAWRRPRQPASRKRSP